MVRRSLVHIWQRTLLREKLPLLCIAGVASFFWWYVAAGALSMTSMSVTLPLNEEMIAFVKQATEQGALFRNNREQDGEHFPPGTVTHVAGQSPSSALLSPNIAVTTAVIRNDGIVLYPRYHFESETANLMINERRFRPGLYTLRMTSTSSATGKQRSVKQEFAWGVLALNADKDRYHAGETADIHIGVLDEDGGIVCDAALTLAIVTPDGSTNVLSTDDGSIQVTGTCGQKEAGLIDPDYKTAFRVDQEGTYRLLLTAKTPKHRVTLRSDLSVESAPAFIVSRKAATRLWPLAPSIMNIAVEFAVPFKGSITDVVPHGFAIVETNPKATVVSVPDTAEMAITWTGSWRAGEQALLSYTYDAPDISPEFYRIGPLRLAGTGTNISVESRFWQIANDDIRESTNYVIEADVLASGGGELALSDNYRLSDTIGEPGIGNSTTANYALGAGYRQAAGEFLSLSCFTSLNLGSIAGVGQTTAEESCTAISDSDAGYTLSWLVRTGSGGTATGSMISQFGNRIAGFSPAVPQTPETWSVAANTAEWGGRLKSSSTDTDLQWGTDTTDEKWLNVGTGSSVPVVNRSSRTSPTGSIEQFQFRAEVGSSHIQAAGTYDVTVDFILSSP